MLYWSGLNGFRGWNAKHQPSLSQGTSGRATYRTAMLPAPHKYKNPANTHIQESCKHTNTRIPHNRTSLGLFCPLPRLSFINCIIYPIGCANTNCGEWWKQWFRKKSQTKQNKLTNGQDQSLSPRTQNKDIKWKVSWLPFPVQYTMVE